MLKKPEDFKLKNPVKVHNDRIELGGGISALLSLKSRDLIHWNGIQNVAVYYADFNVVDDRDNVFFTQKIQIMDAPSATGSIPVGMTKKMVDNLIMKDNIQRQEIAIKSILEKLPNVICQKVSDNLRQNDFLKAALGKDK